MSIVDFPRLRKQMMRIIFSRLFISIFVTFLGATSACSQPPPVVNSDASPPVTAPRPDWITAKIAEYESLPIANPQRSIVRYKFEGKTVFYIPPICCDIPSQLFSEDGKLLCYPDGGFTGRGDERCPTFHKLKREEQLIWQDGRSRIPPSSNVKPG